MPTQTGSYDFKAAKQANDNAQAAGEVADKALSQSIWYATCDTAAGTAAKAATITPATSAFELREGVTVNVKFSVKNTAAVGSLTLNVNNTGAKSIKTVYNRNLSNINSTEYLQANITYQFIYDGTYWIVDQGNVNSTYNLGQNQYYNTIKVKSAIAAESIAVGDSSGYAQAAEGVSFSLSYPILWVTTALAVNSGGTSSSGYYAYQYTSINDRNLATNYSSFTGTARSIVYLVGTVSGNTITITSPVLTCTEPTSDDGKVYIPVGRLGNQSTGANYFFFDVPNTPSLYAYKDGAFGPVSIREAAEAAKTATNYITDLSNGIWVTPENRKPDANGNPISSGNNATSGWHIADALEMFHKGVRRFKVWVENNVTKVRIGKDNLAHVDIDDDSIGLKIGDDRIFEVSYDGNRTQLWFSDSTLSDQLPAAGCKYTNAEAESIFDFMSSSCYVNTTNLKILLNRDDSETGYTATNTGGNYYVHDAEGDAISCGNFSDIVYSGSYGWYPDYYLEPLEEIPSRVVMNACEGEGEFSFRGGMYTDCKVNSGLHSSIKNSKWTNLLEAPDVGTVSTAYAVNIKGLLSKIIDSLNGTHTLHTTINSNASTQSADTWRYFRTVDKNDNVYGQLAIAARANGSNTTGIYAYKTVSGSVKTNALYVGVDKNGNLIYTISSPSAFRTALQLPDLVQRGTTASQSVATKTYKDVSVTFSPAFSTTPTVTCSLVSSSTSSDIGAMSVAVESVSTTGATFRIFNYSANTRAPAVCWIATNL